MAKCASGAMIHLKGRRNTNELYGAYGHNLTYDEMLWLANWCFVRGQNLLIPHAYYYSIRGPRVDERPPDVGPNAKWWNDYKPYADACRRLSWLNTDSRHVCDVALLCEPTWLPDKAAKACYQNQHDFNYLEIRHLWEGARTTSKGIHIAGMTYKAIVLDSLSYLPPRAIQILRRLGRDGHLIIHDASKFASMFNGALVYKTQGDLIAAINKLTTPDIILTPASGNIRCRHIEKGVDHFYMLFNEENSEVQTGIRVQATGDRFWIDPYTARASDSLENETVHFKPYEMKLLWISNSR